MATKPQAVALRPNIFQANQRGQFKELIVGSGARIFKSNAEGVFLGATNYTNAPLKMSYGGVLYATTGTIAGDFTVSGSLFSDDGSAYQTKIALGKVSFLKSDVQKAFLKTPSGGSGLQLASNTSIYFTDLTGNPNAELDSVSNLKFSNDAYISWSSGRKITAGASTITLDGDAIITEGLKAKGFTVRPSSTDYSGDSGTFTDADAHVIRVRGGIITNLNE